MQLKRVAEGAWGRSPQLLGDFCDFAAKIAILTPYQSQSARFEAVRMIIVMLN